MVSLRFFRTVRLFSTQKMKYESIIINVEKSTFSTLVLVCTGGAGPSGTKVITRLVSKVNEKVLKYTLKPIAIYELKISFAILRSCVLGPRVSAIVHEGGLSLRMQLILESTPFSFFGRSIKLRYGKLFYKSSSIADAFRFCFYGTVTDTVRRLCSLQRFDT